MPGGAADGTRSVAANEAGSFSNQTIDIGSLDFRITKGRNAVSPKLIRENKENIGCI